VKKAFTLDAIRGPGARAGLPWLSAEVVFGHRLLLSGERA
jgi:hypothetical protein